MSGGEKEEKAAPAFQCQIRAAVRMPLLTGSEGGKHIPAQMVQLTHYILCPNLSVR